MSDTTASSPVRLTIYGRTYCHLCDEMVTAIEAMDLSRAVELEVIDIDRDPDLESRFGEWVPVLFHGDVRICHYRLDRERLTAHLNAFR